MNPFRIEVASVLLVVRDLTIKMFMMFGCEVVGSYAFSIRYNKRNLNWIENVSRVVPLVVSYVLHTTVSTGKCIATS